MANKKKHKYMLVIERFYNPPVILGSLSSGIKHQSLLEVCERRANCRGEKPATSQRTGLKKKAEFLQSLL